MHVRTAPDRPPGHVDREDGGLLTDTRTEHDANESLRCVVLAAAHTRAHRTGAHLAGRSLRSGRFVYVLGLLHVVSFLGVQIASFAPESAHHASAWRSLAAFAASRRAASITFDSLLRKCSA